MIFLSAICVAYFLHHAYETIGILWKNDGALNGDQGLETAYLQTDQSAMIKRILHANLFKASAAPDENTNVVSARAVAASYELKGTFAGADNTPSYAIIVESGGQEKGYRAGDSLGNNMKIEAIYADHVIIADGASKQTIYLKVAP
jgi:type II secretory pathway component PulC